MGLFDGLQSTANSIVTNTMGVDAVWVPSDGSKPSGYTEKVLFNNPTESRKLSDIEYDPYNWKMEYFKGHFPGLKESVDEGVTEIVTLNGQEFYVTQVPTKYDGKIYIATLNPKN